MGLKGRKRRLTNFETRAEAFVSDLKKGRGFRTVSSSATEIKVGTGKNKRLAEKNGSHLCIAARYETALKDFLKSQNITPKNYVLVSPKHDLVLGVQEYFQAPSLWALLRFLNIKLDRNHFYKIRGYDKEVAKQFAGRYKQLTLEKLEQTIDEFYKHLRKAVDAEYTIAMCL